MLSGTVLVTGGGSGIGRATARTRRRARARRSQWSTGPPRTRRRRPRIVDRRRVGEPSRIPATSATTRRSPTPCRASARELGRVTGVVTAAGIFHGPDLQPAHQVTVDDFVHVLRVNLVGTFAVIKHALPMLIDGGGAIVTIASTAAIRGHGFGAGYTASKGGVDALTRLLAVQYGANGVRANCICPGGVDTPMTGGMFAT